MIAPPYSREFMDGMLPIVQNQHVTSTLKMSDGEDDVTKFLGKLYTTARGYSLQDRFRWIPV